MKVVRVVGLNLNRLVQDLLTLGFNLKNIKRIAYDTIIFEISNNQYKNLLVNKSLSCYNVSVIKEKDSHPLIIGLFKRAGLLVGFITVLALLLSITSKIWLINIEFLGDANSISNEEVFQVLESNNIQVGKQLNVSTRDIERLILKDVQNCASVVVNRTGIKLNISIKQLVQKPEKSSTDIVANYDGKITDINLTSGILNVNIGEGVSKGQVLIASGAVGDFYTEAMGEIRAKVLISGSAVGSTVVDSVYHTGNKKTIKAYEILGSLYYLSESLDDAVKSFSYYELQKTETILFKNNCFPIKLVTFDVYEQMIKRVEIEEAELIENLKQQAYNVALSNIPTGAIEENVGYDIFNENGIIKVVCNIETEIEIGIRK